MPKEKLDHQKIKSMKNPESRVSIYDTVETGLALRVTPTGNKSFYYRYQFAGKKRRFTLGKFPAISLAEARERTRKLKTKVNDGVDPQAEKKNRRTAPDPTSFKEVSNEFIDIHLPTLRDKTAYEYERIIEKELTPEFGDQQMKDISRHQILSFLDQVAIKRKSKTGNEKGAKTMANRIRSVLSRVYSFGIERGLLEANPVLSIPTRKEGENKRERFYSEKEIKKIWEAFEEEDEPVRSVFKMLMLCGQRKTETSRMKWSDIRGDVWTIPASESKSKRAHDVPLSRFAMDVLEEIKPLTGESDFVFESPAKKGQPVQWFKRAVDRIQDRSKVEDFRIHDLRRTTATYMAKLNVDRTVLGKILNHKGLAGDGQVTAIYDRHSYMDEKRQAMNRWAQYLDQVISGKNEAKVYKIS